MEIRMKTLMAGPSGTRHPGETATVSADEAEILVAGGYAEPVDAEKTAEEATAEPGEPADAEKGNRKGKGK